jgi:hypothetical protein
MGDRGSTSHRRVAAREKARAIREDHRKLERRNRLLLRGGIAVAIVAIAAIIALVLVNGPGAPAHGPLNMASDGIVIGKDFKAERTPALAANEKPIATPRDKNASVVSIRIYLDYFCPECNQFESANKTQLASWLKNGAITLEIHPLAIFDRSSQGTAYSTRAANAGACVANYAPDDYWAFSSALFASTPAANSAGLSDGQILGVMRSAGVHNFPSVTDCVNSEKFKLWVSAATTRALDGPLPDSTAKKVAGNLTVIVDGQAYPLTTADVKSASAFAAFVEQAAGSQFDSGGSTSKPTPSPTPTVTPSPNS